MLYRIEGMPGLGWILKRTIFINELLSRWPNGHIHWDHWLRGHEIFRNRECIIPDLSRTYHIGKYGLNVDPQLQARHFQSRPISTVHNVDFDYGLLNSKNYEKFMHKLVNNSLVFDKLKDICTIHIAKSENIWKTRNKTLSIEELIGVSRVIFMEMDYKNHFDVWNRLCTCWNLWNRDARGLHNGAARLWFNGIHYVIVGYPFSPYANGKYSQNVLVSLKMFQK